MARTCGAGTPGRQASHTPLAGLLPPGRPTTVTTARCCMHARCWLCTTWRTRVSTCWCGGMPPCLCFDPCRPGCLACTPSSCLLPLSRITQRCIPAAAALMHPHACCFTSIVQRNRAGATRGAGDAGRARPLLPAVQASCMHSHAEASAGCVRPRAGRLVLMAWRRSRQPATERVPLAVTFAGRLFRASWCSLRDAHNGSWMMNVLKAGAIASHRIVAVSNQ